MQERPRATVDPRELLLTHLAFFLGLRANELIVQRGRAVGHTHFRESHGFVIQHLIDSERTITELAKRMEVTQQAASKAVAEMVELGILEVVRSDDRRTKRVRLSARGWKGVRFARRARRALDHRLSDVVGVRRYADAKTVLLECLMELGGVERMRTRRMRPPS